MDKQNEIELYYPEVITSGVKIGYGWDYHQLKPKDASAVTVNRGVNKISNGDSYCKEVIDVSTASKALNVSMEASYQGVVNKGSGKAELATTSTKTSYSKMLCAYAYSIVNWEFTEVPLKLKDEARSLLVRTIDGEEVPVKGGIAKFRKTYGDYYIHTIKYGGELALSLTFFEESAEKQEEITATMQASGFNWEAKGKVEEILKEYSNNSKLEIFQSNKGGVGPIPLDVDQFKSRLHDFPGAVEKDPTPMWLVLKRYDQLENWPPGLEYDILNTRYEGLINQYYDYLTLYNIIDHIDSNRNQFLWHRGGSINFRDEILSGLRDLEIKLSKCVSTGDYNLPESAKKSVYEFLIKLPPSKNYLPNIKYSMSPDRYRKAVSKQWIEDVSRIRCDWDKMNPGCLKDTQKDNYRKRIPVTLTPMYGCKTLFWSHEKDGWKPYIHNEWGKSKDNYPRYYEELSPSLSHGFKDGRNKEDGGYVMNYELGWTSVAKPDYIQGGYWELTDGASKKPAIQKYSWGERPINKQPVNVAHGFAYSEEYGWGYGYMYFYVDESINPLYITGWEFRTGAGGIMGYTKINRQGGKKTDKAFTAVEGWQTYDPDFNSAFGKLIFYVK